MIPDTDYRASASGLNNVGASAGDATAHRLRWIDDLRQLSEVVEEKTIRHQTVLTGELAGSLYDLRRQSTPSAG